MKAILFRFRSVYPLVALAALAMGFCGAARADVENQALCYRLSNQKFLMKALHTAQVAGEPLTLTIAVTDKDTAKKSGTQAEWESAVQAGMALWTDSLREQMAPLGAVIPPVRYNVKNLSDAPDWDLQLIIWPSGVINAPGVPRSTSKNNKPRFTAYVSQDPVSQVKPIINVFSAAGGWGSDLPSRVNVQTNLLNHEAGHTWGLRDLYDKDLPAGQRGTVGGYEHCQDNLMYEPRQTLGSGDKAGIKAAFIAQLGGGGGQGVIAQGFPTPSGSDFEDARWWIDGDDPILTGPIVTGTAGGYILDGYGGITPFGNAPQLNTAGAPYWPGWDIARALTVLPDASGGWILDGWGGIHNFGSAPPIQSPAYWVNWDIARDLVVLASPTGGYMGYVLDGWGGLHQFGAAPYFPQQNQRLQAGQYSGSTIYHAGQDSAVGLMVLYDTPAGSVPTYPDSGLVLEKDGTLVRFGKYGATGDYHYIDPRFPILNHALKWKKFAMVANGGFYAVGPPDLAQALQSLVMQPIGTPDKIVVPNLWGAWDIVRDVVPFRAGCVPRTDPTCLQ